MLGRKDRMVKMNGQRLEPAEIESALRRMPAVAQAELIVRPGPGPARLVAFVVPRGEAAESLLAEIRTELRARLPAFMVPSRILLVAGIPSLPSGKVDALALQAIAAATPSERP